jgi:hypothetical protein
VVLVVGAELMLHPEVLVIHHPQVRHKEIMGGQLLLMALVVVAELRQQVQMLLLIQLLPVAQVQVQA